ncbi:hypothetical protein [Sphingobacterium detergens]
MHKGEINQSLGGMNSRGSNEDKQEWDGQKKRVSDVLTRFFAL